MDKKLIEEFDRQQKSRKHKHKESSHKSAPKSKHAKVDKVELQEPSTSYRDRAKERREGINKDFQIDPDDLLITNPTAYQDAEIDEEERRLQQIEESKYLGGDVEHTHLVKGLDFALLEKVKREQKLEEEKIVKEKPEIICDMDSDSEEEEARREAIKAAGIDEFDLSKSNFLVPCRDTRVRTVLEVIDSPNPDVSWKYEAGRMIYRAVVDDDNNTKIVTIFRSKDD